MGRDYVRALDHAGKEEPVGAGIPVPEAPGDRLLQRARGCDEGLEEDVAPGVDEQVHAGTGRAALGGGDALAEDLGSELAVLEVDPHRAGAREGLGVVGDRPGLVGVASLHVDAERQPDDAGDLGHGGDQVPDRKRVPVGVASGPGQAGAGGGDRLGARGLDDAGAPGVPGVGEKQGFGPLVQGPEAGGEGASVHGYRVLPASGRAIGTTCDRPP